MLFRSSRPTLPIMVYLHNISIYGNTGKDRYLDCKQQYSNTPPQAEYRLVFENGCLIVCWSPGALKPFV